MDVKKILILGSGTMGRQVAWLSAKAGLETVVYDISTELLEDAQKGVEKIAGKAVKKGQMEQDASAQALSRIAFETDAEAAAKDVDLISESIPEDPKLKGEVFRRFHELCPERTIFTTNTSTLLPSMFAEATGRPQKLVALHFHAPETDRIVDVMPHKGTDPETVATTKSYAETIGMIVIELTKESPGYVFNAMLSALLGSALTLASNGVAKPEDIDRAWMGIMNTLPGPFGLMDHVGLETVWKVTDFWAQKTGNEQNLKNADYIKTFVDAGTLGMKTGEGFYSYPDAPWLQPDFVEKGGKR